MTTVQTPARSIDVAAIRTRAAAASPAPWFWRGNIDHDDPNLCCHVPGLGNREVLRHYRRDRTPDDDEAKRYARFLRDTQIWDETLVAADGKSKGNYRPMAAEEITEAVRTYYLEDEYDQPRTDSRLAFGHQQFYHALDARELAIFEVAPDATDRSDPRIYRADIVGIRHPDAIFMAGARQDVDDLLAILERVAAICTDADGRAYALDQDRPTWVEEVRAALRGVA